MTSEKISIIVITYNRPDDMLDLVKNIAGLENKELLEEVVILNNQSSVSYSAVEDFIHSHPQIPFNYSIAEENLGVARGRNYAAKKSNAPILVFIDDDAVFGSNDVLRQVSQIFSEEKNKQTGIAAFKIFYKATMDFQVNAFPHKQFTKRKQLHEFDTYYFSGCSHAIRKEVFERVGYYPENFFYGMEEYDLGYRAIEAGFRIVYDDRVTVLHKESPTGRLPNKDKLRGMWVNKATVAWKFLPLVYFYSTAWLWSWQYLRKTGWDWSGWRQGWKQISEMRHQEKRTPLNAKALHYMKQVDARMTY